MEKIKEAGVSTPPGTHAVQMLNLYKERYDFKENDFPGAKACNDNSMAIPLHNRMIDDDYIYVVNAIKAIE